MSYAQQNSANAVVSDGGAIFKIAKNDKNFKEFLKLSVKDATVTFSRGANLSENFIFIRTEFGYAARGSLANINANNFSAEFELSVLSKMIKTTDLNFTEEVGTDDWCLNGCVKSRMSYLHNLLSYYLNGIIIECKLGCDTKQVGVLSIDMLYNNDFMKHFTDKKMPQDFCKYIYAEGKHNNDGGPFEGVAYASDTKRLLKIDNGAFQFIYDYDYALIDADTLNAMRVIFKDKIIRIEKMEYMQDNNEIEFFKYSAEGSDYVFFVNARGVKVPEYEKILHKTDLKDDFTIDIKSSDILPYLDNAFEDVIIICKDGKISVSQESIDNKTLFGMQEINGVADGNVRNYAFKERLNFLKSLFKNNERVIFTISTGFNSFSVKIDAKIDKGLISFMSKNIYTENLLEA